MGRDEPAGVPQYVRRGAHDARPLRAAAASQERGSRARAQRKLALGAARNRHRHNILRLARDERFEAHNPPPLYAGEGFRAEAALRNSSRRGAPRNAQNRRRDARRASPIRTGRNGMDLGNIKKKPS